MSESESSNFAEKVNSVANLVKEVPIYQDAIQPIAQETGKALHTVGRVVNVALMPLKGAVWGFEQIEEFVTKKVTKKLVDTPTERIQTPDLSVAGPALESLRYTGHKESLSDLYANLLASSMDTETAKGAHPGFVEIIRNLCPDEAKIISFFAKEATQPLVDIRLYDDSNESHCTLHENISTLGSQSGCENKELTQSYLTNLSRLGLIEIPRLLAMAETDKYQLLKNDSRIKSKLEDLISSSKNRPELFLHYAVLTPFGRLFCKVCVESKA
ncbi:DUF4393 domain-containing protein [Shewanella schlegeliana]|uniref:DUF4393 domain-containing protein n=1 Tax=Shewanella schlegeliana TaxID=190308 RepID=A0ABS1T1D6_9GAMM|nr:DUF4393 domain-containing protein [Shewanella schlegeliana]MBL4914609.1 DUF4393 domain-containing protein [Shewanella schlegeliana]MCL1109575.1 DUF4393 domain-containing protein [Shewanella schlegeliana]GIU29754.1 hypothetical protein TUM4433_19400 [Shewanella schlegeliana]